MFIKLLLITWHIRQSFCGRWKTCKRKLFKDHMIVWKKIVEWYLNILIQNSTDRSTLINVAISACLIRLRLLFCQKGPRKCTPNRHWNAKEITIANTLLLIQTLTYPITFLWNPEPDLILIPNPVKIYRPSYPLLYCL